MIQDIVKKQREYFNKGTTLNYDFRLKSLKKLKNSIKKHENDIKNALFQDLGKSSTESYMSETGMVLSELSYAIKHL